MQDNLVTINFSEEEYEKLKQAGTYGVLRESNLLIVMIKSGLDEIKEKKETNEYVFCFSKNKKFSAERFKSKILRMPDKEYKEMIEICECTPFSMSSLAKYFVLPQIEKINREKRCNYKL